MDKLIEHVTSVPISIPFEWRDKTPGGQNLGRAEFQVCVIYKRGKVARYFVYAAQQKNVTKFFQFIGVYDDFSIDSYDDLEDAKVWLAAWCKEHKTQTLSIYVPPEAKFLNLSYHGISFSNTAVFPVVELR